MHSFQVTRLHPVRDAVMLDALRAEHRIWEETDLVPSQLDELVDCRAVGQDASRREAIRRELTADQPVESLGVWIHYPWSGRLVRVLPEGQLHELRLDRNRDKLTRDEQATLRKGRIAIIGLSVGSAVALTLAQEGIGGRFVLADFDTLSTSNLNRIRAPIHAVGLPKTVIAARQIAEIDPFAEVVCVWDGLLPSNLDEVLRDVDIVVDECDDIAMKVQLRQAARARRLPVLMETSDRGRLDVERYDEDPSVPLLNGRCPPDLDPDEVRAMNASERLALVAEIVGYEITTRAAASMLEIGATLSTWPQLASDVALGGATVTAAARRLLLGRPLPSGLRTLDLDAHLDEIEPPSPPSETSTNAPARSVPLSASHRALIEAATLAPSGGNAQPWAFRIRSDDGVEVIHDTSRSHSALDPEGKAGLLAVGAAIEGMALRASEAGQSLDVQPTGDAEGTVARVQLRPGATIDPLAAHLGRRFTDRRTPERVPLSDAARAAVRAPFGSTTRLSLIDDPEAMRRVGEHIGAVDRVRFLHPRLQQELWQEVRWSEAQAADRPDGISLAEMAVGPGDVPILRLLERPDVAADLRARNRGSRLGDLAERWCRSASALGLAMVRDDTPEAWLAAGRVVHRMWLAAAAHGFNVQPISASIYMLRHLGRPERDGYLPSEIEALEAARLGYAEAFDCGPTDHGALLFRLLAGQPRYAPSHRRPLAEVVVP